MPRDIRSLFLAGAVLLASGCGRSSDGPGAGSTTPVGPHGGPVVTLQPDVLYAEVSMETANGAAKAAARTQVVAYFYSDSGLSAPVTTTPSDVRFELKFPDRDPMPLTLRPDAGAAITRFVSEPGTYDVDLLVGTLSATLGGETITREVVSPR